MNVTADAFGAFDFANGHFPILYCNLFLLRAEVLVAKSEMT